MNSISCTKLCNTNNKYHTKLVTSYTIYLFSKIANMNITFPFLNKSMEQLPFYRFNYHLWKSKYRNANLYDRQFLIFPIFTFFFLILINIWVTTKAQCYVNLVKWYLFLLLQTYYCIICALKWSENVIKI